MATTTAEPRGIRNNNPLNLRRSTANWLGRTTTCTDPEFETFMSMTFGIRAAMVNARTIIRRNPNCTVAKLITVWAPPAENNTDGYLQTVCDIAHVSPLQILDFKDEETMCSVLWAMSRVENGVVLPYNYFLNAYRML